MSDVLMPDGVEPSQSVCRKLCKFVQQFNPYEVRRGAKLVLLHDAKSDAFYVTCHLEGKDLSKYCDAESTIDPDAEEDEIYKLNREITPDHMAYKTMEEDALGGRTFEDLVLEFDSSYRPKKPLKVYGGQHRLKAIIHAECTKGCVLHGVRVYFALTRNQKVEIATVNNTAIAVPNDLLDRMREQLLGTELRDWCQRVGLLESGQDFADRKTHDIPTVRVARTLLVNFLLGKSRKDLEGFHQPILCKSGGMDEEYLNVRSEIEWDDSELSKMGVEFARLNNIQQETVQNRHEDSNTEYARKALSLSVVASWAYAAGLFHRTPEHLETLYALPDNASPPQDPLNAKALSEARLKGTDPDTYRGLGTRSDPKELGRMLQVFLVLAIKEKKQITKRLANAAIQAYEAKKAAAELDKVLEKI